MKCMKWISRVVCLLLMGVTVAAATSKFELSQDQPVTAFSRNSVAYDTGSQVGIDTARTQIAYIPSGAEGELITGGGVAGANVIPQCDVGGVLYGLSGDLAGRIVKA